MSPSFAHCKAISGSGVMYMNEKQNSQRKTLKQNKKKITLIFAL
jgi:hypothetical protein